MVSIPHNAQTSSLEESDKLEVTKELIEVEWRKMKEADDSVLSRQESLQSEEKWSSTRTSAWRTRYPACWAGGRTTRQSCQSCPRWRRRSWRCQPRQQRARECLVLVQTSSPHDCLPPPASQPSKMIIWKCTRWFTVEWSLLLTNSASTPVNS